MTYGVDPPARPTALQLRRGQTGPTRPPMRLPKPGRHDTIQSVDPVDAQPNLRYLLNEWDPIGVADIAPDEYDCLIAPLLTRLDAGVGRAQISAFLWYDLEQHFGLDPSRYGVDSMADRLVAWWATVGGR